jgi:dipeptidyl aminopeptidase/acylaminoacyl peptidase
LRNAPIHYLHKNAPPFLILFAEGEYKAMQRQAHAFYDVLNAQKIKATLVEVPGENHERMVLVLSHPRKAAVPAVLDFINR